MSRTNEEVLVKITNSCCLLAKFFANKQGDLVILTANNQGELVIANNQGKLVIALIKRFWSKSPNHVVYSQFFFVGDAWIFFPSFYPM